MCTIAGYVGIKAAAPILIDMMRREEGFDSGFYTGIATIHEGKLYYAKLTGDLERLLANTDAASLPGNIGVIHSRTRSGGGDQWSHPFIADRDGEPYLAYVSNGSAGFFTSALEKFPAVGEELLREGYNMRSREIMPTRKYINFSDGTSAHSGDVTAQYMMRNIDRGMDLAASMESTLCDLPSEDVGLALALSSPDAIGFFRINQPMMVGFAGHGAYMATTAMVFPEDAGSPTPLPALSSGYVSRDAIRVSPFQNPPCQVAPIDAALTKTIFETICLALRQEKQTVGALRAIVRPLFGEVDTAPTSFIIYETLRSLRERGLLKSEIVRVDGVREDLTAPQTRVWLEN